MPITEAKSFRPLFYWRVGQKSRQWCQKNVLASQLTRPSQKLFRAAIEPTIETAPPQFPGKTTIGNCSSLMHEQRALSRTGALACSLLID
jgi:hypothetical protein